MRHIDFLSQSLFSLKPPALLAPPPPAYQRPPLLPSVPHMPPAMSTSSKPKSRPPAHQNRTAFRHNKNSKTTKQIAETANSYALCPRCADKVQWRIKVRFLTTFLSPYPALHPPYSYTASNFHCILPYSQPSSTVSQVQTALRPAQVQFVRTEGRQGCLPHPMLSMCQPPSGVRRLRCQALSISLQGLLRRNRSRVWPHPARRAGGGKRAQ